MSLNSISLVGRAGRDPELRFFESGSAVASLTLAVQEAGSNRDEDPDWFNLEIWGKQAQIAAHYGKKGTLIGVVGRMTSEQWTDRNTGERRQPLPLPGQCSPGSAPPSLTRRCRSDAPPQPRHTRIWAASARTAGLLPHPPCRRLPRDGARLQPQGTAQPAVAAGRAGAGSAAGTVFHSAASAAEGAVPGLTPPSDR